MIQKKKNKKDSFLNVFLVIQEKETRKIVFYMYLSDSGERKKQERELSTCILSDSGKEKQER